MIDNLQVLKEKLLKALQGNELNASTLLSISHDIASLDQSKTRFSVDAGIIDRLGKELVSKRETAVSELVKNAYDADATKVKLVFKNAYDQGGSLKIIDNGSGMTQEELVRGFMRLASTEKIHEPVSKIYQRKKAGQKGIGRFATQRLGSRLTILTKNKDNESTLQLSIDWDDYKIDKNIFLIEHDVKNVNMMWQSESGTILLIENLHESWSDSVIKRVYRYTVELLQPYPLAKVENSYIAGSDVLDPGFKTVYYRENIAEDNIVADDEEEITQYALAEINGYVDSSGQGYWTLKSNKLEFQEDLFLIGNSNDKDDSTTPFNLIKGLEFKVYYFLYDPSLLPKGKINFIRTLAQEKGGIRLYRNGFRVLPYGERKDDWLELDDSSTRQVILSSHRNINFFGFVQLEDLEDNFQETASREGLIENLAFEQLTTFVYRCLTNAVQKIAHLRGRKATASQKGFVSSTHNRFDSIGKIERAVQDLKEKVGKQNDYDQSTFEEVTKVIEEEKLIIQELIDENNMLRILAGLGLVIGEFVHEIKRFIPSFDNEIHILERALNNNEKALAHLSLLERHLSSFRVYTSFFDNAVTRNTIRELECIELRRAVRNFEDVIKSDIKKSNIDFVADFNGYDLFTIPMHPSEWASILFNLYSNSKKAIKRSGISQGLIYVLCGSSDGKVFLEFSDNGDGISKVSEDFIFDAFYTTSSAIRSNDDMNTLTGTGLGLKIVKDIIESYEGEIFVKNPTTNYSTTIRIEIPEGREDE